MGKMTHLLDENISGNDLIKIYNAQETEKINFSILLIQFVSKGLKLIWLEVLIPQLLNAYWTYLWLCCLFLINLFGNECR